MLLFVFLLPLVILHSFGEIAGYLAWQWSLLMLLSVVKDLP
ncbi:hypothetical protein CWATWH8502_4522 [Crocosphaera watsonii WH 8502]|uniref:Uncharacterized protein n=1 Tax=Crocosphaera watsonii WH 8502 TaxID=423474 RepID=T2IF33_CROWT|nr:hypothetical protein CWATWH8502_4522 [Crocosphaera watsonii WH 8502]